MVSTHRWNLEPSSDGHSVRICRGEHDKAAPCEWEDFVPKPDANQQDETTRLQAIREEWDALQAKRDQLSAEDAAMCAPFKKNGHVNLNDVASALGAPFIEIERSIADTDDKIEAFKLEHFTDLLSALEAARQEIARRDRIIEIERNFWNRVMPCPNCRDKVREGQCERCARQKAEAQLDALTREHAELKAERDDYKQRCEVEFWRAEEIVKGHEGVPS